jgi:threonine/homoserine/homoserine lactone efflux protein
MPGLRRYRGAVVLAAINPKNLLLVVGAVAAIAQTGASTLDQAVALAVFILIATLGVGAPVAIYYLMGHRATTIFGAKLIGDAIIALAT